MAALAWRLWAAEIRREWNREKVPERMVALVERKWYPRIDVHRALESATAVAIIAS